MLRNKITKISEWDYRKEFMDKDMTGLKVKSKKLNIIKENKNL